LSSLLRCTEWDDAVKAPVTIDALLKPLLRAAEGPRVGFFFLAASRRFSSPTEGAW
jgi:hypothetical protein